MKRYLVLFVLVMVIVVVVVGINVHGVMQNNDYCERLTKLAKNPNTQKIILDWVNKKVVKKRIDANDVHFGGGMWPGRYWLNIPFDWDAIGYSNEAQIRLVGDIDENEGQFTGIQSVFFGERSRFGLLVKLPDKADFGVDRRHIIVIDPFIAVVCMNR